MFWPVLLLLCSLVAIIVGLVSLFSGPFRTPSNLQMVVCWLVPIGGVGAAVAAVWLLVLFVRWLA